MARPLLGLLAACACYAAGVDAFIPGFIPGFGSKPLDFFFKICINEVGDEAIGRCLLTHLNSGLRVVRPLFRSGLPAANGSVVVLDPLELDTIGDAANTPPQWEITGIRLSGLSGVSVDKLRLTESTIELEASLASLTAEAQLQLWFLPVRPRVVVHVRRPRVVVTADWSYHAGDLVFSNSEKIVFLSDGYDVSVNSVDVTTRA